MAKQKLASFAYLLCSSRGYHWRDSGRRNSQQQYGSNNAGRALDHQFLSCSERRQLLPRKKQLNGNGWAADRGQIKGASG